MNAREKIGSRVIGECEKEAIVLRPFERARIREYLRSKPEGVSAAQAQTYAASTAKVATVREFLDQLVGQGDATVRDVESKSCASGKSRIYTFIENQP